MTGVVRGLIHVDSKCLAQKTTDPALWSIRKCESIAHMSRLSPEPIFHTKGSPGSDFFKKQQQKSIYLFDQARSS